MRSRTAYLEGPWRGETFLTSTAALRESVCVPTHFYDRVSPSPIATPIGTQKWKVQLKTDGISNISNKEYLDQEIYAFHSYVSLLS